MPGGDRYDCYGRDAASLQLLYVAHDRVRRKTTNRDQTADDWNPTDGRPFAKTLSGGLDLQYRGVAVASMTATHWSRSEIAGPETDRNALWICSESL